MNNPMHREMKLLSVIIPMYNVESYVERCIRSLENQDIPRDEYEIICINDGSPDDSRGVVVRLQKEFKNIILIDQKNQGVSQARNHGMDKARGRYLLFIDPDDFVDPNRFGSVLQNIDRHKSQVSFLGYTVLNEDGGKRKKVWNTEHASQVYTGTEAYYLSRGDGSTDPDRMWAVLYDRDFINERNLRYLPDVPYLEDGEFIARILCLAEQCIFDGHSFYQRTKRPGSATNSGLFYSERATHGFLLAASHLKRVQKGEDLNDQQRDFLNQPIAKFVLLAVSSAIGWRSARRLSTTVRSLRASGFGKICLKDCHQIYLIYGRAYNMSPYLGAIVIILYPRINRVYQLIRRR